MALHIDQQQGRVTVSSDSGQKLRQIDRQGQPNPLSDLTAALAWIDSNVTDVASARVALKHLTRLIHRIAADVERGKDGRG